MNLLVLIIVETLLFSIIYTAFAFVIGVTNMHEWTQFNRGLFVIICGGLMLLCFSSWIDWVKKQEDENGKD